jgi:hypothetical protein
MTPAMLAFAMQALEMVPLAIDAGTKLVSLVTSTTATIKRAQEEKRDILPEEWAAQDEEIARLRKELHA